MKALIEIGFGRAARYLFFSPLLVFFKFLCYSPLRVIFLRLFGARIGGGVVMHDVKFFNLYRGGFGLLKIGRECFIGDECMFDLADKVVMGSRVTFGERITVLTHMNVGYKNHPLQKYFPSCKEPVVFRRGCFIGTSSTILPGVVVGECSAVAAGSLVKDDVPPYTLVGGVPAKVIRRLG